MCRWRRCLPSLKRNTRAKEQLEELARELSGSQSAGRAISEALREIEEDHHGPRRLASAVEQSVHRAYELLSDGSLLALPTQSRASSRCRRIGLAIFSS